MKICDAFDLVKLSEEFVASVRPKIEENFKELAPLFDKLEGTDINDKEDDFEALVHEGKVVGYVKKAHDVDVNLKCSCYIWKSSS